MCQSKGADGLIATALLEWSGDRSWPVSVYLMGTAVLTLTAIYFAAETFKNNLDEEVGK
ncbi:MAG: hypothetical protein P1U89_03255 [Verrucomicrobiales bacterium]|nr:hypothetical protein [Verrucomicrobiales bacterium]